MKKWLRRKRCRVGSRFVIGGIRLSLGPNSFSLSCSCLCWLLPMAVSSYSKTKTNTKNAASDNWRAYFLLLCSSGESEKQHSFKHATKQSNSNKNSSLPHDWLNLVQGTKPRLITCLENVLHTWLGLIRISLWIWGKEITEENSFLEEWREKGWSGLLNMKNWLVWLRIEVSHFLQLSADYDMNGRWYLGYFVSNIFFECCQPDYNL